MYSDSLVSCIVLTYNKFDFFFDTIDSILQQNYLNIELIICDDGSQNFEKDKIREYIQLKAGKNISKIIIHHHEKNIGTVKNFNSAIKLSRGKYIFPLSSDDLFFDNNTITKIVEFFKQNTFVVATAYRDVYSEDLSKFISREPQNSQNYFSSNSKRLYKNLCFGNIISGASTYYTSEFFEKDNLFDEQYLLLEDYPKYLSFTRKGGVIGFMSFCTIKYREGGISTNINHKLEKDFKLAIEKEVLPYKNILGLLSYRRIKFIYRTRFYNLNKNLIFILLNIDIAIAKLLKSILSVIK